MILSCRNQDKPVIEPARPLTESSHNLPDTSRILLLGDSSVTDVRASNQLLKISSDEKNDLFNVYSKLSNMSNDSAKSVVLSIGMNNCLSSKTVSQINKDYEILLNEASRVSQLEQVKVSSVCLRSEMPGIQSKVNQVNLDLSKLCDSMNCVFVDHSLNFFFRDGSVDYSLYCSNESKLSQKGSARHMLNLGLSEMIKVRTYVPSDNAAKIYTAAVTQDHSRPEQKRRFYRHLANQNSQRHPYGRKVPRCWNCGERGHLQDWKMYADDTCLKKSAYTVETLQTYLRNAMVNLCEWCKANHLVINIQKSNYMIICNRQSFEMRILFYNLYILPHIDYCINVWGNASQCHIDKLQVLQNRAACVILDADLYTSSQILLKRLKSMSIAERKDYQTFILLFKVLNGMAPESLNIFEINETRCNYLPEAGSVAPP